MDEEIALWRAKDGKYTSRFRTKDTWNEIRNVKPTKACYKWIWFANATPKYSFIAWLATFNCLSTGDRMLSRNAGINSACVFCHHSLETRSHFFFECSYSGQVWHQLNGGLLGQNYTSRHYQVLPIY